MKFGHRIITVAVVSGLLPFGFSLIGCGGTGGDKLEQPSEYVDEINSWRQKRLDRLKSPTGWLSLVGLHWLKNGANTFGAATSNNIVCPEGRAPEFLGTFLVENGVVTFVVEPEVVVTHKSEPVAFLVLHHDNEEDFDATVLEHETLTWYVIKRGDRLGVRVKDSESKPRREFKGIESYPIDYSWRIEGVLKPHVPPQTLEITDVLGTVSDEPSPGSLLFEIDGMTYSLDPIAGPDDKEMFVIFADATSGKETYGGGRFLSVARPGEDGKVVIDFNKAYNPPCALTPFATCPLPPSRNQLIVPIRAGEKTYEKPEH